MKRIFNTSLLLLALCFAACSMDKMGGPEDPGTTTDPGAVGYLRLGGLAVNADTEVSEISRAGEAVDTKSYEINIYEATSGDLVQGTVDGEPLAATFTYGDLTNGQGGQKLIELKPGTYRITAHTPGQAPATSQQPWYTGETYVTVTASNTQLNPAPAAITCKLGTIRVTVELSADLKRYFKSDEQVAEDTRTRTRVTIGGNSVNFGMASDRYTPVWYFKDVAGPGTAGNEMKVTLMGYYYTGNAADLFGGKINEDYYQWIEYEKSVQGVKAGTYRDIRISIDYDSTGNLAFVVEIQSYVYDDEIEVDASSSLSGTMEPSIPDDDEGGQTPPQQPDEPVGEGPTIVWVGKDIEQRLTLTDDNIFTETCQVQIISAGLEHLYVNINDGINNQTPVLDDKELSSVGLRQKFDLADLEGDTQLIKNLQDLGFLPKDKTSLAGETDVTFDISQFLAPLHMLYSEDYDCDFELTAVDKNGSTMKSVKFHIQK